MRPTYGKDRRYRFAYAVAPALADRPRLAAINGVATVQPAAISRTLLADGVRTAISSDVGTDATAVFRGLAASISRPDGLSLQQAFAAVTSEAAFRSEEHTSELQSPMPTSYAGLCLNNKKKQTSNADT